jgi:uncharacterized membrane protein
LCVLVVFGLFIFCYFAGVVYNQVKDLYHIYSGGDVNCRIHTVANSGSIVSSVVGGLDYGGAWFAVINVVFSKFKTKMKKFFAGSIQGPSALK